MEGSSPRYRNLTLPIRVLTVLIVAMLLGIALMITGRTEAILIERFDEYHLTMVRLAAHEIEHAFADAGRMVSVLGDTLSPGGQDVATDRRRLQHVVEALVEEGAVELGRVDASGRASLVAYGEPAALQAVWSKGQADCRAASADRGGPCAVPFVEPHDPRMPPRVLLLATALAGGEAPSRLVLVLDWQRLASRLQEVTTINRHSAGWLLDGAGTLLWSIAHPEMVRRSAVRPDASCHGCHTGFDLERRMTVADSGVGEVSVRGAPRKLVAWARLDVFGLRWALAGSAPYDDVVASGRRNRTVVFVAKGFLVVVIVVLAVLLDVQNRRRIRDLRASEEAVKRSNEQLEGEVRRRTEELHALWAEMNEVRSRFTALERLAIVGELASIVAHEVRTPLNSLAIACQRVARMLRTQEGPDVDKAREIVESQSFEIRRIDGFIEEYLRLVRLPKPSRKPHDINAIVRDVLRFMEVEEQRHQIRFLQELEEDLPAVEVDADQIRQVLLNLLVNAIQAMPEGGEIRVRTRRTDDAILLVVADTGPGIAPAHMPKLFEPFFTTKEKGTGLGLAICTRLAREHGGTITCESEPGKGASFVVRLPLRAPPSAPPAPAG